MMNQRRYLILCLLVVGLMLSALPRFSASAVTGETITDYYSPCRYGLEGTVSTWHSMTQNGQPPLDPERRTFDFRCPDKKIYAPHEGIVWGVTLRYGGLIMIDDASNNACIVFLGMHQIEVEADQVVASGTFLGGYGHAFHLTALEGGCEHHNWYDHHARAAERPVIWRDIGYEMSFDIQRTDPVRFVAGNPATAVYSNGVIVN